MPPAEWFCTLLDTAPDVYFRYALEPERRLAYVSPAVTALTGHPPEAFYADRHLCFAVVAGADRRLLRRLLRARRDLVTTVRLVRDGVSLPVDLRTVVLVRRRRIVAIEGVARLAVGVPRSGVRAGDADEPVQQRLAALLVEVHDLLHLVARRDPELPAKRQAASSEPAMRGAESVESRSVGGGEARVTIGDLVVDRDGFQVTESGVLVPLTPLEFKVLAYLLDRSGRVVTRTRLLQDVWDYRYTGDDRTVDVHVSRLRRKLPSLRGRLTAIRNIGYRLDLDAPAAATGS